MGEYRGSDKTEVKFQIKWSVTRKRLPDIG